MHFCGKYSEYFTKYLIFSHLLPNYLALHPTFTTFARQSKED